MDNPILTVSLVMDISGWTTNQPCLKCSPRDRTSIDFASMVAAELRALLVGAWVFSVSECGVHWAT